MLVLLAVSAIVAPTTVAIAQTPPPSTSPDPITIKECRVPSAGILGRSVAAKMGAVELIFANAGDAEITAVRFRLAIAGINKATAYFSGHYSPGAVMTERLIEKSLAPITDMDAVTCAVASVTFADGKSWYPSQGSLVIIPQADSPVTLQNCSLENITTAQSSGSDAPGYNLLVLASFESVDHRPISAVRIHFDIYDAFDAKVASVQGTVTGKFTSGALVQPMQDASGYTYTPSSPAWRYYVGPGSVDFARGVSPNDLVETKCWVQDVRFEDGTIWRASTAP